MFTKIVVALDGSECALQAFDIAIRLAKSESAPISICAVVDPMAVAWTSSVEPAADLLLDEREQEARDRVSAALAKAHAQGVVASGETHVGVPFDEIIQSAIRHDASVIVMGTHGRSGLQRLFMGSVAESVLREAPCPVIVVRARHEAPVP